MGIGYSQDYRSQWDNDDGVEEDSCHPTDSQRNDSLETAWFPSQKLEDVVARLQRDVAVYRKELRFGGG